MNYDFSEMKKQNDLLEKELQLLKKEYKKPQMPEEKLVELRTRMENVNMKNRKELNRATRWVAGAAAFIGAFVILPNTSPIIAHAMEQIPVIGQLVEVVTFRDYVYESETNQAQIEVPEIYMDEQMQNEQVTNEQVQEALKQTTLEINAEMQQVVDELVAEFEAHLKEEEGYQDVVVTSEVLATTEDYFTLKLLCYKGSASGYQWNYYYTIDMNTGERLLLKDIFTEGADYITVISDNIKQQMQERMNADSNAYYWLNDELEELNFKAITEDTLFYINENNNVVIGFNEGDVAPMYMGTVEFEIPAEVLSNIRK